MCSDLAKPARASTAVLSVGLLVAAISGQELPTTAEALALAFPKAKVERRMVSLDDAQRQRIAERSGQPCGAGVVFVYEAHVDGKIVGAAYFDRHAVRALQETLLVAVDAEGKLVRVEVVAFAEPRAYLPRAAYYRQFPGRGLSPRSDAPPADPKPTVDGVRGVAGATLTSRATVAACQRVLALHEVLQSSPPLPKVPEPADRQPKSPTPVGGQRP